MNAQDDGHASTPIVVMKFGGTSVATEEGRAALVTRVIAERDQGSLPVVVVSAMGRKGDPYATDTLLSLVDETYCHAHELDLLMGVGEIISAVVVAALLNERGVVARALTGADAGILTDDMDGAATIQRVDVAPLRALLEEGIIAVVAGFQGVDEDGLLHTLGRGGSDTTACALGAALEAARVDIYTDVDGVFTADPRLIEDAKVLSTITADELFQMARHGSRVVHTPAAELILQSGVKLRVRNTFSDNEGTEVVSLDRFRPNSVATAVTTATGITRLRVRLPYVKDDARAHMTVQTRVYRLMADASISIDMFTPMNDRLVFSIPTKLTEEAVSLLSSEGFEVATRTNLGKVTLVGSGMHGVPGVMARVAEALSEGEIDVLQIADSHATISLLVDEDDLISAARQLHHAFGL
ncbi:MAG: aspartate kinase [Coriobacteriales bacterium]|jgi:aspartate kinase|nr:aspartate kinase [Coriobacteriales bacterium]